MCNLEAFTFLFLLFCMRIAAIVGLGGGMNAAVLNSSLKILKNLVLTCLKSSSNCSLDLENIWQAESNKASL